MTLQQLIPFFGADDSTPSGPVPRHQFVVRSGGSGATQGYNAPGGWGSFVAGTVGNYTTPAGKAVTIIHCRNLRNDNLVFGLNSTPAAVAADFPDRIVVTRGTLTATMEKSGSPRNVQGGVRQDYSEQSGEITNVFRNGEDTNVDLYYGAVDRPGSATLTFPNANSVRSDLTDPDGVTSVQEVEFILPGGSALRTSPTRLNTNSFRATVPLGTFGQWHVHWNYTDGNGAGKRATATASR